MKTQDTSSRQITTAVVFCEAFLACSHQARCAGTSAPGIYLDGTNVAGQTTSLSIGQVVTLTAEPTNGSWENLGSAEGNPLAGFGTSGCRPLTSSCSSNFTYVDYSKTEITLFWYVPGTYKVGYQYDGQKSVRATFVVSGPTVSALSAIQNNILVHKKAGVLELGLGELPKLPGITFSSEIGSVRWLQIVTNATVNFVNSSGSYSPRTIFGLDANLTYPTPPFYPPVTKNGQKTDDTPDIPLCKKEQLTSITELFATYLLWKSAAKNSTYVPIGVVYWSWGAVANNMDGSFSANAGQPTYRIQGVTNNPINDFPIWNTLAVPWTDEETCP